MCLGNAVCGYCGEINSFDVDEDGRVYCIFCGHYTGDVLEENYEDW